MISIRITDISIDGFNLKNNDFKFWIDGLFDLNKEIVTNDLYIDGDSYYSSKIASKKLVLNGYVFTKDVTKIMQLNSILAKNALKKLTVNILGLGELYCYVEVENKIKLDRTKKMSMQLNMSEPYLYSLENKVITLGAVSNNGLSFPLKFPLLFGVITGGQGIVTNNGNTKAYPVIIIVGTCNNISITNQTTGEIISINVSLLDSDILIMDNRPSSRGIYLNGIKRMDLKDGNWLSCDIGDNQFSFSRNSLQSDKKHCTIELQSRWI